MPGRQAKRRVENGRLVYYMQPADKTFWDRYWTAISPELYDKIKRRDPGQFDDLFLRHLPRDARILEAGCGLGKHVETLRALGYDAEGVDWAEETVKVANAHYPDLPIRLGDVTRLEVPDGHYGGYISLGVMEHRREGPGAFLDEAYRVLEPGGVAFIAVPYFNSLRTLKARLGLYRGRTEGLEFYQYAYTEEEFAGILSAAGFKIIEKRSLSATYCLEAEIPPLTLLFRCIGIGWRLRNWLDRRQIMRTRLGHMLLMVCQKTDRQG